MKFNKHPLLIVFTSLILVIFLVAIVLINFFLDSFVKDQISRKVYESSRGLYSIKIEDLNALFWTGTVKMKKVLLYQHPSRLKTLKETRPKENISTIKLYMHAVRINHIRWINYLISNDLKVGKISINSPEITVKGSTFSETIQETNKKFTELLPAIIAGFAGSLRIEEMSVESGKFKYDIETQKTTITQTADHIFINLNDIIIDTIPSKKILYSEDIHLSLSNYRLKSIDDLHTFRIDKISGILSDSTLQFEKLYYSKTDTVNRAKKAIEIFIENIKGESVSFRDFFNNKKIFIGKLFLESPQFSSTFHQRPKGIAATNLPSRNKNSFFVSPLISGLIKSFTINDIQASNGTVQNKTYTFHDTIFQKADNINLRIIKVAGEIVDSLKLIRPDHIEMSFSNYELNLFNPKIRLTIEKTKASSFDSTIHMSNSKVHYKDERTGTKKIYLNNSASLIRANGFDLHALLDNAQINFKKIVITNPKTDFRIVTEKGRPVKDQTISTNFGNLINSWNVDRIHIENGRFIHEAIISGDTIANQTRNYNLTIQGISATSDKMTPNVSDIYGEFKDYELKLVKEKLILTAELSTISSKKNTASVKNLSIKQYHPHSPKENVFNTTIPEFTLIKFDLKRVLYKSEFNAGAIVIKNMDMRLFMKEGKALKPDYAKLMPNEMAQKIPFYFKVDMVKLGNGKITFMEEKTASEVFTLNKTRISIFNLTNDKKMMTIQYPARVYGETQLLEQGKLLLDISVPLLSPRFDCSFNGKIGSVNIEAFNNILSYAKMKAERGQIDSGSFAVNVTDGIADGNLKIVYHDFHIKAMDSTGNLKKMKSIIGNFVIKNNNPNHKDGEPEIVQITSKRESEDSIFSLLWRPIKEGVIKTVTKDTFVGK